MSTIRLEVPDEILRSLDIDPASFGHEVMTLAAVKLFELGKLASGGAARSGRERIAYTAPVNSETVGPGNLAGREPMRRKLVVPERKWLGREWWDGVRPYVLRLSIDLAVSLLFLISTWCFQQVAKRLFPVDDVTIDLFHWLHFLGAVASFGTFTSISVRDIWRISNGKGDGDGS